jgi:undecaprenyl pyrophosphate phosphatase UppP
LQQWKKTGYGKDMSLIEAIILGAIQGLTEFLPVMNSMPALLPEFYHVAAAAAMVLTQSAVSPRYWRS